MTTTLGRFVLWAGAACAAAAALWDFGTREALARSCADVALVLAVDGSSSVDNSEYRLQQQAISAALRNADVLDAMEAAGSVAVAVVFWGDPDRPTERAGPIVIEGAQDAEQLARMVERLPRLVFGNTGLNTGLQAALDSLDAIGCAHRRIVNVSGDGRGTILSRSRQPHPRLAAVRADAEAAGITINALTISDEEDDLAEYYRTKVITGDGAFVMDIETHADYAAALRRKLVREIAPLVVGNAQ